MGERMNNNPVSLGDDGTLRLGGVWMVEHAAALKAQLLETLASARPQRVDISGIQWIDTAGLQLLLALVPLLHEGAEIVGANPDVQRSLQISGVASALESQGVAVDFNAEV